MDKLSQNFNEMFWIYWYEEAIDSTRNKFLEVIVDKFDKDNNAIEFKA